MARDEATTKRSALGDLLDRVFQGSTRQLVMQALAANPKANPDS
jgi:hypothetical protein